jgi:Na+-transporting methylmalonyl-CoA/oxaloacetate decarboxylase beta subunit
MHQQVQQQQKRSSPFESDAAMAQRLCHEKNRQVMMQQEINKQHQSPTAFPTAATTAIALLYPINLMLLNRLINCNQ